MRDVDERRPSLSAAAPSSAVCFAPLYYLDPATGRMVFVPPAGRGTKDLNRRSVHGTCGSDQSCRRAACRIFAGRGAARCWLACTCRHRGAHIPIVALEWSHAFARAHGVADVR